jgi:hypothetical protein
MKNNFLSSEIEINDFDNILKEFNSIIDSYRLNNQGYFYHIDKTSFLNDCKTVKKYFEDNFFETQDIMIVEIPPHTIGDVHIDTQKNTLALNFPVVNCDNSYTSLYKINSGVAKMIKMTNGLTHISFNKCDFTEIDRFYLKENAVLFNTKIPHNVINLSDKLRIAVSFRFVRDPWSLVV